MWSKNTAPLSLPLTEQHIWMFVCLPLPPSLTPLHSSPLPPALPPSLPPSFHAAPEEECWLSEKPFSSAGEKEWWRGALGGGGVLEFRKEESWELRCRVTENLQVVNKEENEGALTEGRAKHEVFCPRIPYINHSHAWVQEMKLLTCVHEGSTSSSSSTDWMMHSVVSWM